jgi:hypothetical protein
VEATSFKRLEIVHIAITTVVDEFLADPNVALVVVPDLWVLAVASGWF